MNNANPIRKTEILRLKTVLKIAHIFLREHHQKYNRFTSLQPLFLSSNDLLLNYYFLRSSIFSPATS